MVDSHGLKVPATEERDARSSQPAPPVAPHFFDDALTELYPEHRPTLPHDDLADADGPEGGLGAAGREEDGAVQPEAGASTPQPGPEPSDDDNAATDDASGAEVSAQAALPDTPNEEEQDEERSIAPPSDGQLAESAEADDQLVGSPQQTTPGTDASEDPLPVAAPSPIAFDFLENPVAATEQTQGESQPQYEAITSLLDSPSSLATPPAAPPPPPAPEAPPSLL